MGSRRGVRRSGGCDRRVSGFTLIELMLVLAVVTGLAILSLHQEIRDFRSKRAAQLGMEIYTYNNAVRTWLTVNGSDPSNHGTYNGTAWLKSTSCGGTFDTSVVDAPLSCGFPNQTSFGSLAFQTVVSDSAADFDSGLGRDCVNRGPDAVCAETILPSLQVGGSPAPDLAGIAALVAAGGAASNLLPVQAATDGVVVLADDRSIPSSPELRLQNAEIVMVAGHSDGNDAWLRTDGSNDMWAPLTWSQFRPDGTTPLPASERVMQGVTHIQGFVGDTLTLGRGTSSAGSPAATMVTPEVIVDADARIIGDLDTLGNVFSRMSVVAGQDVVAGRNVFASNDILAGREVQAGTDVRARRDIWAERDLRANRDAIVLRDVSVGEDLSVGRNAIVNNDLQIGDNAAGGDRVSVQEFVRESFTVPAGRLVNRPSCPSNYPFAKINVSPAGYVGVDNSSGAWRYDSVVAAHAMAWPWSGNRWRVDVYVKTSKDPAAWKRLDSRTGVVNVSIHCSNNV